MMLLEKYRYKILREKKIIINIYEFAPTGDEKDEITEDYDKFMYVLTKYEKFKPLLKLFIDNDNVFVEKNISFKLMYKVGYGFNKLKTYEYLVNLIDHEYFLHRDDKEIIDKLIKIGTDKAYAAIKNIVSRGVNDSYLHGIFSKMLIINKKAAINCGLALIFKKTSYLGDLILNAEYCEILLARPLKKYMYVLDKNLLIKYINEGYKISRYFDGMLKQTKRYDILENKYVSLALANNYTETSVKKYYIDYDIYKILVKNEKFMLSACYHDIPYKECIKKYRHENNSMRLVYLKVYIARHHSGFRKDLLIEFIEKYDFTDFHTNARIITKIVELNYDELIYKVMDKISKTGKMPHRYTWIDGSINKIKKFPFLLWMCTRVNAREHKEIYEQDECYRYKLSKSVGLNFNGMKDNDTKFFIVKKIYEHQKILPEHTNLNINNNNVEMFLRSIAKDDRDNVLHFIIESFNVDGGRYLDIITGINKFNWNKSRCLNNTGFLF